MQTRNLHNNTVVCETLDKGIGKALCNSASLIVIRLMLHVEYGFLDIAHLMSQKINRHHGQGMTVTAFANHILGILILNTQILTEAERFCRQPRFLQFNQYELFRTVGTANCCTEVNTEY